MEFTIKTGGGAPAAGDIGMGATSGAGASAAAGGGVSKFHLLDSGLLGAIAGFVPRQLVGVSRKHRAAEVTQTAVDANKKLYMLEKVKALKKFAYLSDELPPKIDANNLNFDSIRSINRLFKRVCTDIGSLESIRSKRESTIEDVYRVLKAKNTGEIIQEGKDLALQKFTEVLRQVLPDLRIPAAANPQQIRAWFAAEANQEVLGGDTALDLSEKGLRYLPDEIEKFRNITNINLSNNPLNSVPDSIRSWFLAAAQQHSWALQQASEGLRADRDVVLAAVRHNGIILKYASKELKADRGVVLAAVTQNGMALEYASEGLRADRDVVLAAVMQNGMALEYASEGLIADRGVVLAAVMQNGMALEYASEGLIADRGVVLAAVKQSGFALRYVDDELRGARDIVLVAVTQAGWALEHASEGLRNDRDIVLVAVTQVGHPQVLDCASAELKVDPKIRAAAGLF